MEERSLPWRDLKHGMLYQIIQYATLVWCLQQYMKQHKYIGQWMYGAMNIIMEQWMYWDMNVWGHEYVEQWMHGAVNAWNAECMELQMNGEKVHEMMNTWSNEWIKQKTKMHEMMNASSNELWIKCTKWWMHGAMNVWINKCMKWWMRGATNAWINEFMAQWMYGRLH